MGGGGKGRPLCPPRAHSPPPCTGPLLHWSRYKEGLGARITPGLRAVGPDGEPLQPPPRIKRRPRFAEEVCGCATHCPLPPRVPPCVAVCVEAMDAGVAGCGEVFVAGVSTRLDVPAAEWVPCSPPLCVCPCSTLSAQLLEDVVTGASRLQHGRPHPESYSRPRSQQRGQRDDMLQVTSCPMGCTPTLVPPLCLVLSLSLFCPCPLCFPCPCAFLVLVLSLSLSLCYPCPCAVLVLVLSLSLSPVLSLSCSPAAPSPPVLSPPRHRHRLCC
jgi:hypothetical protein